MNKKDMREMFIIFSLQRALDDRLLMIDDNQLRQMNKVIFKRLSKESKNLYKQLDKILGMNIDTMDDICDKIHETIDKLDIDV